MLFFLLLTLFAAFTATAPTTHITFAEVAEQMPAWPDWFTHVGWGLVLYDVLSGVTLGYLWLSGKLDNMLGGSRWWYGEGQGGFVMRGDMSRQEWEMRRLGLL
ncbi:hypothetical protein BU23DRAFT_98964 [Bimuria novae-zelandiae CBS 107.79]|uniref:Uncharacterized protein n=1 Tax=Bimuria novae-zelandiae CBS 107.79 TaxID=1447943 RepID=A0A6A5VQH6_9PLEO|nr:hypothetical protein BU23DRAFT_98964 [Bimuria novae-zelandiae CBS 107.79]